MRCYRSVPRAGSSLVLLLATVSLITLFLAGVLYQLSCLVRHTELAAVRSQCLASAQGGLEVARAWMASNPPPDEPLDIEVPAHPGQCRVRVSPEGRPGGYRVTVAACQTYRAHSLASYEIEAILNKGPEGNVCQVVTQRFVPRSGRLPTR